MTQTEKEEVININNVPIELVKTEAGSEFINFVTNGKHYKGFFEVKKYKTQNGFERSKKITRIRPCAYNQCRTCRLIKNPDIFSY